MHQFSCEIASLNWCFLLFVVVDSLELKHRKLLFMVLYVVRVLK